MDDSTDPRGALEPPLDEAALAQLVDRFYDKVRQDALIGPVFNAAVHDWPQHKRLLTSFWSSITLRTGSYRGNPMAVHRGLSGVSEAHFSRWLELWWETTAEVLAPAEAALLRQHAERIGTSLKLGMGLLPRGRDLGLPIVGRR